MKTYSLLVSNIGFMGDSYNNLVTAKIAFYQQVKLSSANFGRAAGEDVTLFNDETGEPVLEYTGSLVIAGAAS